MAESHACCSFCRKPSSDVGPLVQGPDDVYICRDCSELCLSVVDQEDERRQPASLWPPRIEEIGGWLEGIGIRAELAKTLAIAARSHYERVSQGQRSAGKAILLLGPDRSSRLILACALAHSLRVPFTSTSSQRLASGRDVPADSIFYGLLQASDFDAAAAQRGVVYVEGADDGAAQDALLEVISGKQPDAMADRLELDASDLLFVCGGQFAWLDAAPIQNPLHQSQAATREELISCGMLPELASAFGTIAWTAPLDHEFLARVVACLDFKRISGSKPIPLS